MANSVMIASAGTGGHVFPALAIATELQVRGVQVSWIGTEHGMENSLVPAAGIELDRIAALGFRGKGILAKMKAVKGLLQGCFQTIRIIHKRKPDLVLGMGGFVTVPAGLIAWLLRVPVVIHEQNRVVGTANRILAPLAKLLLEAFPCSFDEKYQAIFTGNPLRQNIVNLTNEVQNKEGNKQILRILVIGGSQGAKSLNEIVPTALAHCKQLSFAVNHQCGKEWLQQTLNAYQEAGIPAGVEAFISDMSEMYRWADLVISRSGAMTVSELAAAGVPAILIPYPHAIDDHQTVNANYLVDAGAAVLIKQKDLSAEYLAAQINELISDPDTLPAMAVAACSVARINAAQQIADLCLKELVA